MRSVSLHNELFVLLYFLSCQKQNRVIRGQNKDVQPMPPRHAEVMAEGSASSGAAKDVKALPVLSTGKADDKWASVGIMLRCDTVAGRQVVGCAPEVVLPYKASSKWG